MVFLYPLNPSPVIHLKDFLNHMLCYLMFLIFFMFSILTFVRIIIYYLFSSNYDRPNNTLLKGKFQVALKIQGYALSLAPHTQRLLLQCPSCSVLKLQREYAGMFLEQCLIQNKYAFLLITH